MTQFLDLLNYYTLYQTAKNLPAHELAEIAGCSSINISFCKKKTKSIDALKDSLRKNPEKNGVFFRKALDVSRKDINALFIILEVTNPGLVKKRHIFSTICDFELDEIKTRAAVFKASENHLLDHEIAAQIGVPIKQVKAYLQNLPVANPKTPQFEFLRRESHVREFFNVYPYSTISEASKALKMSVKETRVIVEDLIKHGEIIKFNNMPRPLEFEERKLMVIELKKQNPGLSEKEISLQLGISISQVRQAIQDTIRIWQMEKVVSYDFYSLNMLEELNEIKKEAMERHKASNASSSRWLEIFLIASQKQIDMLGLKAPEKIDINKKVVVSKEQRDSVVDAYMATETLDVEFEKIEVTGS